MLKIISGGQTGVDRAALDVALELGLPVGGWCPKGRKAEDGPIAPRYPLQETPSEDYAQRTEWNVRDSDGSLILKIGELFGGTKLAEELSRRYQRPCMIIDLDYRPSRETVQEWLALQKIQTLSIGGPRASSIPDIYEKAATFLRSVLK